jgi:peptidoglycan/xylan/chitin deacetylase (PgdA/CDA1 family)
MAPIKKVAGDLCLTYDDGPNLEVTPRLLELLAEYEAHATFFVSGHSLMSTEQKRLLCAIRDGGHTIGNHGMFHRRDTCPAFCRMSRLITETCGVRTYIVRAPYGQRSLLSAYLSEEPRAVPFEWSWSFNDWEPVDFDSAQTSFPKAVQSGSIVLLHDGVAPLAVYPDRHQVVELTRRILDYSRTLGLKTRGLAAMFPEHYDESQQR